MISGTIWNNLVSTLERNPTLKKYVNFVYEGRRFNMEPESLPCIMLEPTRNSEPERRTNNVDYQFFHVDLFVLSSNNFNEFPKAIVGDQIYKGILNIENDVRACLKSSYSLGGTVHDIRFEPTVFDVVDIDKYPVRGALIPLRILYRQVDGE